MDNDQNKKDAVLKMNGILFLLISLD